MNILRSLTVVLMCLLVFAAGAAEPEPDDGRGYGNVPSGTLVMPGERESAGRKSDSGRKCMKVCKEWGETCIIDPRTGGRKCRRSCEQFGIECFE